MSNRLSAARRITLREQAWQLSLKGRTEQAMADELGLTRTTVRGMIREEAELVAEQNVGSRSVQLAQFEEEQRASMRDMWDRLQEGDARVSEAASAHDKIQAASVNIAKARGLFATSLRMVDKDGEDVDLRALMEHPFPIQIEVPDGSKTFHE